MAAQVFVFPGGKNDGPRPWTVQERADVYRTLEALTQAGLHIDLAEGVSEDGAPWFAFVDAASGESVLHVALEDGDVVVLDRAGRTLVRGRDVRGALDQAAGARLALTAARGGAGELYSHPLATFTALTAVMSLLRDEEILAALERLFGLTPEPSGPALEAARTHGGEAASGPAAAARADRGAELEAALLMMREAFAAADQGFGAAADLSVEAAEIAAIVRDAAEALDQTRLIVRAEGGGAAVLERALALFDPERADPAAVIRGTEGDDILIGGDGADVVIAGDGDDRIESGAGNDVIFAGAGDDVIDAGDGDDVVFAGAGDDVVDAGAGDDVIFGGDGDDVIHAGDGDDVVIAGEGDDTVDGGAGDDVILAGDGEDVVDAGDGDDVVTVVGDGGDTVDGGDGDDVLINAAGGDGARASVFIGGDGADEFINLAGDAVFQGRADEADQFEVTSGTGHVRIEGFDPDQDVFYVSNALLESAVVSTNDDGDVVVIFSDTASITLVGWDALPADIHDIFI